MLAKITLRGLTVNTRNGGSSETFYADSAPVRAALCGRILAPGIATDLRGLGWGRGRVSESSL